VKPAQCKFWQEFYDDTGGGTPLYPGDPNKWKNKGNCNRLRYDPCLCGGITCDPDKTDVCVTCKDGDITGISFRENGLKGTISSSIGELTGLTSLDLTLNELNGTISSSISKLTSMTYLRLNLNQLTGSIPSELADLKSLTSLGLGGPSGGGSSGWANADPGPGGLTGSIPSELATLTALTSLYLVGNQLTGLVPPLPFEQYTDGDAGDCTLDSDGCNEPDCNHFKCPLPATSDKCKSGASAGVHCK
jgi:Leucine-rich repeat (LRR) protein